MTWCPNSVHFSRGMIFIRSCSILGGSVFRVSSQRRLMRALAGPDAGPMSPNWLTPQRRKLLLAVLLMLVLTLIAVVFEVRWQ